MSTVEGGRRFHSTGKSSSAAALSVQSAGPSRAEVPHTVTGGPSDSRTVHTVSVSRARTRSTRGGRVRTRLLARAWKPARSSSTPSAVSTAAAGVGSAPRRLGVHSVDPGPVRLPASPEGRRGGGGEHGPALQAGGCGPERVDRQAVPLGVAVEQRVPVQIGFPRAGRGVRCPAATNAAAQRCAMPVWLRRSRIRHPGPVGTGASGPASRAAETRARPSSVSPVRCSAMSTRRSCQIRLNRSGVRRGQKSDVWTVICLFMAQSVAQGRAAGVRKAAVPVAAR